jgi:hypothetical protein
MISSAPRKPLPAMSWADRLLLAEALATLAAASLAIRLLPFRRIAAGAARARQRHAAPQGRLLARVRWSVDAWARRVPWRAVCFQKGLAVHWMLRRRGIDSVLHYGAAHAPGEGLSAHVWVTVGTIIVTGGGEASRFARLASFPPQ